MSKSTLLVSNAGQAYGLALTTALHTRLGEGQGGDLHSQG